eukprot:Selendium_serpulae@DN5487_c0_g1_i3.p2
MDALETQLASLNVSKKPAASKIRPIRDCDGCKESKPIVAKGLCNCCYQRGYHATRRTKSAPLQTPRPTLATRLRKEVDTPTLEPARPDHQPDEIAIAEALQASVPACDASRSAFRPAGRPARSLTPRPRLPTDSLAQQPRSAFRPAARAPDTSPRPDASRLRRISLSLEDAVIGPMAPIESQFRPIPVPIDCPLQIALSPSIQKALDETQRTVACPRPSAAVSQANDDSRDNPVLKVEEWREVLHSERITAAELLAETDHFAIACCWNVHGDSGQGYSQMRKAIVCNTGNLVGPDVMLLQEVKWKPRAACGETMCNRHLADLSASRQYHYTATSFDAGILYDENVVKIHEVPQEVLAAVEIELLTCHEEFWILLAVEMPNVRSPPNSSGTLCLAYS